MSKQKRFMIVAVVFYVWYVYTAAVYEFPYFTASGKLYSALIITAPLLLLGVEGVASFLGYLAPILFLVATVIIDLLPEFTKKQKIALTVMPIVSYALFWVMDFAAPVYFHAHQ